MPRVKPHHHPCQTCGAKTECGGTWEEHYDGFQAVICPEFHRLNGSTNGDFICHDCNEEELEQTRRQKYLAENGPDDDPDAWSGGFAPNH